MVSRRKAFFRSVGAVFLASLIAGCSDSGGPWEAQLKNYGTIVEGAKPQPPGGITTVGFMYFTNTTNGPIRIERAWLNNPQPGIIVKYQWWMTGEASQLGGSSQLPGPTHVALPTTVAPGTYGSVGLTVTATEPGVHAGRGVWVAYRSAWEGYKVYFPLGIVVCTPESKSADGGCDEPLSVHR